VTRLVALVALAAAGVFPAAAFGVSGKAFTAQVGDAFAFQTTDLVAAGAVAGLGIYYEGLFYAGAAIGE
jgi:hypothetical protein